MLDHGHRSARNAKSGVDVGPLSKATKVTREMARRYTEGGAIPDVNKMQKMADWLGVRLAWLRDGEGSKRAEPLAAREDGGEYSVLGPEAREVAAAWAALSPDHRSVMRDLIFMLRLGERRFPWMLRGRPTSETYAEWERRQEDNFLVLSQLERDRKVKTR
jgi:transcriptional regulator with XRE-family HTH domain